MLWAETNPVISLAVPSLPQLGDTGFYTCVASSPNGEASWTAYLQVEGRWQHLFHYLLIPMSMEKSLVLQSTKEFWSFTTSIAAIVPNNWSRWGLDLNPPSALQSVKLSDLWISELLDKLHVAILTYIIFRLPFYVSKQVPVCFTL